MPRPRKQIVCVNETPYYHVTSRCVRRAFLCGEDPKTGQSYEHRRAWIEERLRILSSLFSVEICAYAVMSNHYHVVVRLNPDEAATWSDDDVLFRWTSLYRGPLIVRQHLDGKPLSAAERDTLRSMCSVFRRRLASLSWFMKCLNEPIARRANAEDGCTGHFWEARFHSQALKSERALLAAMAYVDLNPIRASLVRTPEESCFTSIRVRRCGDDAQGRLAKAFAAMLDRGGYDYFDASIRRLMPFSDTMAPQADGRSAETLPMREKDYLKLVDDTGRIIIRGRRGRIDPDLAPILDRLGLSATQWVDASTAFRKNCRRGDLVLVA